MKAVPDSPDTVSCCCSLDPSAFRCDLVVAIPYMGLEVHTCGKRLQRCFAAAACLAGCHIIDSSTAMLAAFVSACICATAAACICRGTGYSISSCPMLAFRCIGTASDRGSDGLAPTLAGEEAESGFTMHGLLCHLVSVLEGAWLSELFISGMLGRRTRTLTQE